MDVTRAFRRLTELANGYGFIVKDHGNGHLQVKGAFAVSYYPESKRQTAYVAHTTHGISGATPEQVVAMARGTLAPGPRLRKRKRSYRKERENLIRRWESQGRDLLCHWCSDTMTVQPGYLNSVTLEHIVPLAAGGRDVPTNHTLACVVCNCARGGKTYPPSADRREFMAARMRATGMHLSAEKT
jgi:hypothetical protein